MKKSLIEQIEDDALDSDKSVADALRKCIALGGRAASDELRTWASQELSGYLNIDDIPVYRIIAAPLVIDGISGNKLIKRQQISSIELPNIAQEAGISETLRLPQGIGELEELARRATQNNESVMLGVPGDAHLAKLMTSEINHPYQAVDRIYWNASPTAIFGVVDQIRTKLVELVAQIRSDTGSADDPTADAVQNAVNVVFHKRASRVHINTAQSSGSGSASITTESADQSSPWWRTTKALWGFVVGLATIAAAILAFVALD